VSEQTNGSGIVLKWAHLILALFTQVLITVGGLGAVYGTLKFQVEDQARRLTDVERKQDANFIPRSEYDRRHDDLLRQLQELREEMRDLEHHK
jgi:hypothetical protein